MFKRLEYDDPRILFVGGYTGCCERFRKTEHNITSSIIDALQTRKSAFYVVEDAKGKIRAHSWVWRGVDGELCFDGFEALEKCFSAKNFKDLTVALQSKFSRNNEEFRVSSTLLEPLSETFQPDIVETYGINGVFIGHGAKHLNSDERDDYLFVKEAVEIRPNVGMSNVSFYAIVLPEWAECPDFYLNPFGLI